MVGGCAVAKLDASLAALGCWTLARGSVFDLSERGITDAEAGRLLHDDYLATGSLERRHCHLTETIKLVRTACGQIVRGASIDHKIKDTLTALEIFGNQVVVSIASEIETAERNRPSSRTHNRSTPGESLQRGLWQKIPLLLAMLRALALALFRLGDHEAAAECSLETAARPNAPMHIQAIATHYLAAAGRLR